MRMASCARCAICRGASCGSCSITSKRIVVRLLTSARSLLPSPCRGSGDSMYTRKAHATRENTDDDHPASLWVQMRLFALLRPDLSMGKINELLALRTLACMIAPQYKAIVVTRHHSLSAVNDSPEILMCRDQEKARRASSTGRRHVDELTGATKLAPILRHSVLVSRLRADLLNIPLKKASQGNMSASCKHLCISCHPTPVRRLYEPYPYGRGKRLVPQRNQRRLAICIRSGN